MVEQREHNGGIRLLLRPNRSLSWRNSVRIWLGMCTLSLIIVTVTFLAGAWLVMPFAGLEVSALGAALYYTARQCRKQEVLDISPQSLHLEKGLYRKEAEWELPRQYTRIHVAIRRHPWTPPKLSLSHRDLDISLAAFLNIDDTRLLISILERQGLRIERKNARQSLPF